MEQFDEFNIVISLLEVFLQKDIDTRFEDKGIVNSNHTNILRFVPTRLTTTSDGSIHNIIGNQKESLKLHTQKNLLNTHS